MGNILKYQGIRKDGTPAGGAIDSIAADTTPAWLAEQLFDKGWRRVTITRGGQEVGGIGRVYGGPRDWWG